MNLVIAQAIQFLANIILGMSNFDRILGSVQRWADAKVASAEKRHGVLAELEVIGIELSESLMRLGIELAVAYLKQVAK
jgi:hypothetical protein